jgi:hypothetical protein
MLLSLVLTNTFRQRTWWSTTRYLKQSSPSHANSGERKEGSNKKAQRIRRGKRVFRHSWKVGTQKQSQPQLKLHRGGRRRRCPGGRGNPEEDRGQGDKPGMQQHLLHWRGHTLGSVGFSRGLRNGVDRQ